jgi:hypothetical protein
MPRARQRLALRIRPRHGDEHAAAVFAPAYAIADSVDQTGKRRQRGQQAPAHQPRENVERTVQHLRYGTRAHPHGLDSRPQLGKHVQVRYVHQ